MSRPLRRPAAQAVAALPVDPLSISTSYFVLRNGIAAIALAFPVALIAGVGLDHVQTSLSAYYHFSAAHPDRYGAGTMRDVFVGALCTIGAFLLFYRGCTRREDMTLNVAGVAAVLVALFPMDWPATDSWDMSTTSTIHFASAAIFFVMIGYVCVFRAHDTLRILKDEVWRRRFERVYLVLGALMIAVPGAIYSVHMLTPRTQGSYVALLIELAGVVVFAAFWLVKGYEMLLVDRESGHRATACRREG